MPQTVEIPGQGIAEFPDEMTPDDIKGVIQNKFYASPTPEASQSRMGLGDLLFDKETAQNLRGAIQDVVYSLPGMAAQIPKMAYQGLKFAAGGLQQQTQVAEEALTQAKIQGDQMAKDVLSPLGSRESFRGIANLGLMAAPAVGEALGEAALLGEAKPPIQGETLPQIPETPISDAVKQQTISGYDTSSGLSTQEAVQAAGKTLSKSEIKSQSDQWLIDRGMNPETADPVFKVMAVESTARAEVAQQNYNKLIGGVKSNAEQIISPTQIHGDVLNVPRPEESTGQVPANVSSEGVQTRGQGEIIQKTPQEVISQVAIRNKDTGKVTSGVNHTEAYLKAHPEALDADEWSGIKKELTDQYEHGFVTNNGRFVPREEAHLIAKGTTGELTHEEIVPQPEQPTPVSEPTAETPATVVEPTTGGQAKPPIPPTIGKDVTKDIPDFPKEKQVGLTQDFISKDREARGEAPLSKQARQTNPEIWDRSAQQFQSNPNIGHELVADLMENPRPLQEGDAGVLLRHRVNLTNETDLQYQKLTNPDSTPIQKGEALSQLSALKDARNDADTVLQNSSSTMGRSFQFLKSLAAEDYSLSGISQQRRAAMGGKELTLQQEEAFTRENAQWSKDILEKDKALQDYQKTQGQQESALKSYKTRLKTATTEYERRLAFSDYEEKARNAMQLDPEAQRLKGELETSKLNFQKQLIKDQISNFPWWKKVLNGTAWVARESALSGYHILAKLASFTGSRLAEIPLTETAERGWGMIPGFRDIAAHSEFGAGANAQALGELYTKFATDGMRQAVQQMRSGVSEVRAAYGKEKLGLSYPSFFGNLHAVEKTPLLVGSQAMNRIKLMNKALSDISSKAVSEGLDITDPTVQAGINKKAFDAATYDILQEQSGLADAIRGRLSQMEGIQKKTGEYSIEGNILSALIKTFVTKDILRTPLNYVKQTFERTPLGLTRGVVRAGRSIYKGVENVKPDENAAIMKLMGIGSVGTGMFIWGAIDALKPPNQRVFGGYYQPGEKRDTNDVKWATLRPFGVNVPHYLSHFPAVESAQMGNTMMRVALSSLSKKDRTNKGLVSGIVASTLGLAYQAPIAAQVPRLGKLQDPRTQATALGDVISGLVPSLVRDIATDTDKAESRKATTTLQSVESAIPGLREQVPERTEKVSKNRPR